MTQSQSEGHNTSSGLIGEQGLLAQGIARGFARRDLLRGGMFAALGAALMPQMAWAEQAVAVDYMANVRAVMKRWVGPGLFPGMIASLGFANADPHYAIEGTEGFNDADPMSPDSLFRIYSMTKPITGMAAMMLIDRGLLKLDQPLSDILPKFAKMNVQVTPDGSLTELVPAQTPITIRHLLTHTAGFGYSIVQRGPLKKAYEDSGLIPGRISHMETGMFAQGTKLKSLAEFADKLAEMPLVYEPGTHWSYSVSLDVLGRVIEVVSGLSLEKFLQEQMFGPLGMESTWFQVPAAHAHRLTVNHAPINNILVPIDPAETSIYLDTPPFAFGGSGLISSPRDYDRFMRMLAQYGVLGRERIMSEAAVRQGTNNLLPEGVMMNMATMPPALFGAGGRVGIGTETGIFGWAGAAGTVATVNMAKGIRSSIFVQFMPPNANSLLSEYQQALAKDLQALGAV